jgi:hypothetical protein
MSMYSDTRLIALACRRLVEGLACFTAVPLIAQTTTQGRVQTLDTPSFTIRIEVRCPEGEVTCDDVSYRGENKRTKRSANLEGRTAHSMCADKVTPGRFLGYVFRRGNFTYFVSDAGELIVRDGEKVIVQESGVWQ